MCAPACFSNLPRGARGRNNSVVADCFPALGVWGACKGVPLLLASPHREWNCTSASGDRLDGDVVYACCPGLMLLSWSWDTGNALAAGEDGGRMAGLPM